MATYLGGDVIKAYYASDDKARGGIKPVQWRDAVIAARLKISDDTYSDFKTALKSETTGIDLGLDLAALGVSGAASVASAGTAQALSAANTGILGAGTAFNKESLYQSTLPALLAQMDANRLAVLVRIRQSQSLADDTKYSLLTALSDLDAYEEAGTLTSAIQSLTTAATNSAATNKEALDALTGLTVVPVDVQAQKEKFSAFVATLVSAGPKADLDQVVSNLNSAFKLNIAVVPNAKTEGISVLEAVDKLVNGPAASAMMAAVIASLKSVPGQPF